MMNRIEEVLHIRSHFRQSDDADKMKLVYRPRDVAIKHLEPRKAKFRARCQTTTQMRIMLKA